MKKIEVVKAKTPEELVKKLNSFSKETFATTIMQELNGEWIAFAFYYEGNKTTETPKEKSFEPVTEKQRIFLERNDYRGNIDELSKDEAKVLIKEFIEGK